MTISIDLLRVDEDMMERLIESQCCRYPEISVKEHRSLLQNIQSEQLAHRIGTKDLDQQRSLLKDLQKALAPTSSMKVDKEEAKQEIKKLKKIIQSQQDQLHLNGEVIREKLSRVGNIVDLGIKCDESICSVPAKNDIPVSQTNLDPVFCLGGYEKMGVECSGSFTILMGHVARLAEAITSHAITAFESNQISLISSVPESISLEPAASHSILGCQASRCRICYGQTKFPSFLVASMMHKQRTYWDRELPIGQVYFTTNQHNWDPRESDRLASFCHTKRKWFEDIPSKQVQLLGMTICTLEESRRFQLEIADKIVDLHRELIVPRNCGLNSSKIKLVRKRSIQASELLPFEASRVVIEGYLLGNYVRLGHVSNGTDFLTRTLKTRCGGAHVDYVHGIYATCCSIHETLEWVAQNNVLHNGVAIPSTLGVFLTPKCTEFLAFQKRLVQGKSGRKPVVKELPRVAPLNGKINDDLQKCTRKVKDEEVPRERKAFALDRRPNEEEVRAERYISPFDFLPFFSN